MPSAIVIGGGLAGLASAAALGQSGFQVDLFESRGFLGGRATSYPVPGDNSEVIDNCQHVLLRCCVNLMDFYGRLGVADRIQFHKRFYFIEPGGRTSTLEAGALPAPLHFTGSFRKLAFLSLADKIGIARALLAIRREYGRRTDLDRITMLAWLQEKRQTARGDQPILEPGAGQRDQRRFGSHGRQPRISGLLAGLFGAREQLRNGNPRRAARGFVWSRCLAAHCQRSIAPASARGSRDRRRRRDSRSDGRQASSTSRTTTFRRCRLSACPP